MGESKRRHLAAAANPCRCGSTKPGGDCCWREQGWHKSPTVIDLMNTGHSGSHGRCYLRELNSCSQKLSGEHFISATVLKAINEKAIRLSGVPWITPGETKVIPINSLVANCLCTAHNSALSPLDDVAGRFYGALKYALAVDSSEDQRYLFSGHDIERWLLKTLAGLAASQNLSSDRERLPGIFDDEINVPELLQNPMSWKPPVGMYSAQALGQKIALKNEFEVAPLSSDKKDIGGMVTKIHGLTIVLLAVPSAVIKGSALERSLYRLTDMNFKGAPTRQQIELSWEQGARAAM